MSERRQRRFLLLLPAVGCAAGMLLLTGIWRQQYRQEAFTRLSSLCGKIAESDPQAEQAMLQALKESAWEQGGDEGDSPYLEQYGYAASILDDPTAAVPAGGLAALPAAAGAGLLAACYVPLWWEIRRKRRRIGELTRYLERVNTGAAGTVVQTEEDDFSHLQDELYKTVTSLYATREAAVQAKKNYGENLANIAHQLKTPITAALLSLQLIGQSAAEDEIPRHAGTIKKQLLRLETLEEALLSLSKVDAGTLQLEKASVDVYTVLCLAAENLEELCRQRDIRIDIPDKGSMEIRGDMEWLMEAVMNLMKNCIEHSPAGGTVHCDYADNLLYTRILLWDEGPGFDGADIPHLFERFYRGKDASKEGAGIGLALAHSILELSGAALTASNRPEGGACFEIRFYSH